MLITWSWSYTGRIDPTVPGIGRSSEALRHHLVGVFAEIAGGEDSLELALHQRLARRVVPAPRAKRLNEAGGGRRIERIEGDHLVGEKPIAGTARVVKA